MNDNGRTHNHIFEYRSVKKKKLILSLIITLAVMVLEIIGTTIQIAAKDECEDCNLNCVEEHEH